MYQENILKISISEGDFSKNINVVLITRVHFCLLLNSLTTKSLNKFQIKCLKIKEFKVTISYTP